MAKLSPFNHALFRTLYLRHNEDEWIIEMLDWAMEAKRQLDTTECALVTERYHHKRLQHENDFMIKWINSRIQDEFKQP